MESFITNRTVQNVSTMLPSLMVRLMIYNPIASIYLLEKNHLHELMRAVEEGHRATAFFVIQMADVVDFAPNDATHPAFGEALRQAKAAGVNITAYSCRVTPDSMAIDQPVEVLL